VPSLAVYLSRPAPTPPLFPYTTLFRSHPNGERHWDSDGSTPVAEADPSNAAPSSAARRRVHQARRRQRRAIVLEICAARELAWTSDRAACRGFADTRQPFR